MNLNNIKNILTEVNKLHIELSKQPGIEKKQPQNLSLEQVVTDKDLYKNVKELFNNGHHAEAVKKAFVFLDNLVKSKSELDKTGADLMRAAFSANRPILRLNSFTSTSENNEQQGYMEIFAGAMIGIRNPRAHEHDWEDTQERALQLLGLANHLIIRTRLSTK